MNQISLGVLLEKMEQESIQIIDIRSPLQHSLGYIPTSINIPYNNLVLKPENYLNKSNKYYIYCQTGSTSEDLVYILNYKGYNTVNIIGGYNNYLYRK